MLQQLAELSIIYPECKPETLEHYLTGISQTTLMRIVTHLIGKDLFRETESTHDTISNWFQVGNEQFAQDLVDRIAKYELDNNRKLKIVNPISCLQILQKGLQLAATEKIDTKSQLDSEQNLMIAMLMLNGNLDYNQTKDTVKIKELFPGDTYLSALLLNHQFPTFDLVNFHFETYTACQVIKSLILFRFLESTAEGKALLQRFCEHYSVANWKEYYERFVPVIMAWSERKNASSVDIILERNSDLDRNESFLTKFALTDYSQEVDQDYKELRGKPLIPLSETEYRIIHPLFISDKLYKGLYFLFNELNKKDGKIIFSEFRSWYTTNFSEAACFTWLLEYSFPASKILKFDRDFGIDGAPDAYLRLGNDIFLFESKDVLLNASIKQSYDFQKLINELKVKFLVKSSRAVGIGQLINNIRRTLTLAHPVDQEYHSKEVKIYPILVTHDRMFDTPGLNEVLNFYYLRELSKLKEEGLDTANVAPLIVINVDALIEIAPLLRAGKVTLKELITEYFMNYNIPPLSYFPNIAAYEKAMMESKISFLDFIYGYLSWKLGDKWRSEELIHQLLTQGN
ncbi:hypothetical protein [uncultured Chitinophaga sp.]|uniref:hypothetical protein n=1 Tax=uncultured Chitinophaga sp. TaxID=339340 RepID=UPI0025D93CB8|nr:hypothetical protein [uncultured Chitinophaga sp.]